MGVLSNPDLSLCGFELQVERITVAQKHPRAIRRQTRLTLLFDTKVSPQSLLAEGTPHNHNKRTAIIIERETAMENWNQLVTSHGNWAEFRNAAMEGDEEKIRLHLAAGIDPNFQPFDTNPLFEAIRAGQINSVKLLIRNGADPRIREVSSGMTAEEVALHEGQDEIADYINLMLRYM